MVERFLITLLVAIFFGGVVFLVKRRQAVLVKRASGRLQKTGIPTIVYFWSAGCPVCKLTQRRVLDAIVAEYGGQQLALVAYNIDEAPEVAKEWGVMTLPTTILLDAAGAIRHVNNGLALSENIRSQLSSIMF